MKLVATDFLCCLICSVSTSPFSGMSTFDYGFSSSLKTSLPNINILIFDSYMQEAVMYIATSAIPLVLLFYGSQRFIFSNSRFCLLQAKILLHAWPGACPEGHQESKIRRNSQPAIFWAKTANKILPLLLHKSVFTNSSRELQGFIYKVNSKDLYSDKETRARNNKVVLSLLSDTPFWHPKTRQGVLWDGPNTHTGKIMTDELDCMKRELWFDSYHI